MRLWLILHLLVFIQLLLFLWPSYFTLFQLRKLLITLSFISFGSSQTSFFLFRSDFFFLHFLLVLFRIQLICFFLPCLFCFLFHLHSFSFGRSKLLNLHTYLIDVLRFLQVINANIKMLISKSYKPFFVQAFVVVSFAAPDTSIAFKLCRFRVDSITWVTVMCRASKLLGDATFIFYYLSSMVRKFPEKGFRKKTWKVIELGAFTRKRAFIHRVLILNGLWSLLFAFWIPFWFSSCCFLFMVNSLFQANWTLEFVYLLTAVETFRFIYFRILPFFKLHCNLIQFVCEWFFSGFAVIDLKAFFVERSIANSSTKYWAFWLFANIAQFVVIFISFLELLVFHDFRRRGLFFWLIFNAWIFLLRGS